MVKFLKYLFTIVDNTELKTNLSYPELIEERLFQKSYMKAIKTV